MVSLITCPEDEKSESMLWKFCMKLLQLNINSMENVLWVNKDPLSHTQPQFTCGINIHNSFSRYLGRKWSLVTVDLIQICQPHVSCGFSDIEFTFKTQNSFSGKIYVKGHYNNPDCRIDNSNRQVFQSGGKLKISHGSCDMIRHRTISPQGMQFSTVVVISFHPIFVTKVDKAFNIKCTYREATKMVTASLDVSMLPTIPILQTLPMPSCVYTIRKDEIDGEILRYAKVGDQVVHRWECESDLYGILVHSCYVEDGQGEKVEVVNAKGCHRDRFLLGDPTYIEALNMAYRESHVFKFADRVAVRFLCQIKLCLKADGGCLGVTPPLCNQTIVSKNDNDVPKNRTKRLIKNSVNKLVTNSNRNKTLLNLRWPSFQDGDFQSQYLYVMDSDETGSSDETALHDLWISMKHNRKESICLNNEVFIAFTCSLITIGMFMTFFILVLIAYRCPNKARIYALKLYAN